MFAWSTDKVHGVRNELVEHNLNFNPSTKLVRQKLKPLDIERRKIAYAEILKLKNQGFIKDIQYPKWLANNVMVKKSTEG